MALAKRISLFLIVNVLVIITISIILNVLGVRPYITAQGLDYEALMAFCLIWGMTGAFISLGLSRIMAKMMMKVQLINPQTATGHEKEILDMVYRFAKVSGITKMPEVGIYDSPEINAFATGPTKTAPWLLSLVAF
jgi:heat shock protein HtpX